MEREQFEKELDAWLADVRAEALKVFDDGTPPAMCLGVAQERVHWRWVQLAREILESVVPARLFPLN